MNVDCHISFALAREDLTGIREMMRHYLEWDLAESSAFREWPSISTNT